MSTSPSISIVLGTYNRLPFLKFTIASLREEISGTTGEIIVVDGGSEDGTVRWLAEQKDIITIVQHNHGEWQGKEVERKSWGYFMNLGFRAASGKYVCMLSDDCLVVPGAIKHGIEHFEDNLANGNSVGAVAFYWRNWPEQNKYWVGLTLGGKMFVNHGLYLRQALRDVDYIDADSYDFYHADGDLCLKLWAKGYTCIDSPDSYIEHFSHANRSLRRSNLTAQKRDWERYLDRWEGIYYDRTEDNTGTWVEKEFNDPSDTAQRFKTVCGGMEVIRVKAGVRGKEIAKKVMSSLQRNIKL